MDPLNINTCNISYSAKKNTEHSTDKKLQKKRGSVIVASTVGVGLATLALGTGLSRANRGNVNKLYNFLTKKSHELSSKKIFTKTEKAIQNTVNMGKSAVESTRSIANTISLKDILFKKFTSKIPFLGKACQAVTNFFEGIAVKTTLNSYSKTNKNFNKMYSAFEAAGSKLSSEAKKVSNKKIESIKKVFDKNFSTGETLSRIQRTKKVYQNLDEEFWNASFKNVRNLAKDKNTYSSFIAEKMMAGKKSKLISEINLNKSYINFSHQDDYNNLKNLTDNIKGLIDPFNKKTASTLENIRINLETFNRKKSPLVKEAIIDDMKKLTEFVDDKKIAEQFRKSIDSLPKTKTGNIESLLEVYKKELSEKDYNKLQKQVNKAIKSLEKSTTLEADNLFDKMRDLKIGSAPTDMLTLLTTFATVGVGLGKAENSDERKSAALRYGIPAIGTVLTTMYGTMKLFAGIKSLAFGAVSGFVIGKIGAAVDDMRLRAKEQAKQNDLVVGA